MVKLTVTESVSPAAHSGGVDIADIGVVALPGDTNHVRAEIQVTVTRRCQDSRLKPQGGVVVASGVIEGATSNCRVFVACRVVKERSTADADVEDAGSVRKECLITNSRIKGASGTADSCAAKECLVTDRRVLGASAVSEEGLGTERCVAVSGDVIKKGERSIGRVVAAGVVKDHRVSSNGRVLRARGVQQKRCCAHCGIGIRVVESQRSTANAGIEAAGAIKKKRTPPKSCISSAGG